MKFVDIKNDIAFRKIFGVPYAEADKHNWQKEELIAYDNASIRDADTEQELRKAKDIGKLEEKIQGVVNALKRNKLTIEEIAEDFDTTVDFVLKIKKEHNL
jgi:hypothetical protein